MSPGVCMQQVAGGAPIRIVEPGTGQPLLSGTVGEICRYLASVGG